MNFSRAGRGLLWPPGLPGAWTSATFASGWSRLCTCNALLRLVTLPPIHPSHSRDRISRGPWQGPHHVGCEQERIFREIHGESHLQSRDYNRSSAYCLTGFNQRYGYAECRTLFHRAFFEVRATRAFRISSAAFDSSTELNNVALSTATERKCSWSRMLQLMPGPLSQDGMNANSPATSAALPSRPSCGMDRAAKTRPVTPIRFLS